jgi:flagellar biosynthesis protein FlhG
MSELSFIGEPSRQSSREPPIAPSQRRRAQQKRLAAAPTFAVTSGKGGVGKTIVVAKLAVALSLKQKRVMVIDADLGLANLDLFFGVKPKYTLADFFSGAASLDEIITISRDGILLLPGASGVQ